MKKVFVSSLVVLFLSVICLGFISGSVAPKYKIGDFVQGGIVFWVDKTGAHGLVCAKSDIPYKVGWMYAEDVCNNLSITQDGVKYDDWYLPSIKELSQVYDNYVLIDKIASENGGDVFKKRPYLQLTSYWSSTEHKNSGYAYRVRFANGGERGLDKYYRYLVRAIRAF